MTAAPPRRAKMLTEARRLAVMLLEARVDFLRTQYIPRIEKALPRMAIPGPVRHDLDGMEGQSEAEKVFNYVIGFDPSPVKQHAQWLLNLLLKPGDQALLLEDLPKATDYLTLLAQVKARLPVPQRDANRYRSLADLYAVLKPFEEAPDAALSQGAVDRKLDQAMHDQTKIVYNGADYKILIPLTREAAKYFGRNTKWCTTWDQGNYFQSYSKDGPLFIILDKANNNRWQFHFASRQFMNEMDQQINLREFVAAHPKVEAVFKDLDGEPIGQIGKEPVFAQAAGAPGFLVKSAAGLLGSVVLSVAQGEHGPEITGSAQKDATLAQTGPIAELLAQTGVTGNAKAFIENELYWNRGKWGSMWTVGDTLYKFTDGAIWKSVTTPLQLGATGETSDQTHLCLYTRSGEPMAEGEVLRGALSFSSIHPKNKALIGDHVITLALADRALIQSWPRDTSWGDLSSKFQPSDLTPEQARRLVDARPELADFTTLYKAKGDIPEVRTKAVEQMKEEHKDTTGEWIGDKLVIARYDNVFNLVEALVYQSSRNRDGENYVVSVVKGEERIDYSHDADTTYHGLDLLRSLPAGELHRLGAHLASYYPDEVEDMDDDWNPEDAKSIWTLLRETDDDEVMEAMKRAILTGEEDGAADEAHSIFVSAVEGCPYVLFEAGDDGEDGSKWAAKMQFDTPCVFAIPLAKLVHIIDLGETDMGPRAMAEIEGVDALIKIEQPYNGFSEFNKDSAHDRFADEIDELLPAHASA